MTENKLYTGPTWYMFGRQDHQSSDQVNEMLLQLPPQSRLRLCWFYQSQRPCCKENLESRPCIQNNANQEKLSKFALSRIFRVSVRGVKSLSCHFACLCWGFDCYEVNDIFQKEKGNTFTLLIIFIVKSLQKEQNSTNLLL